MSARNTSTFGQLKNISETTQGVITDEDILAVQIGSGELVNVTHQQFFDFIGGAIDQTPWVTDIDAADNILFNLQTLNFKKNNTIVPDNTSAYINFQTGAFDPSMVFNVPANQFFRFTTLGVVSFEVTHRAVNIHHSALENVAFITMKPEFVGNTSLIDIFPHPDIVNNASLLKIRVRTVDDDDDFARITFIGNVVTDEIEQGQIDFSVANATGTDIDIMSLVGGTTAADSVINVGTNVNFQDFQLLDVGTVNFSLNTISNPADTTPFINFRDDNTKMIFNVPEFYSFSFVANGVEQMSISNDIIVFDEHILTDVSSIIIKTSTFVPRLEMHAVSETDPANLGDILVKGGPLAVDFTNIVFSSLDTGVGVEKGQIDFKVSANSSFVSMLSLIGGTSAATSEIDFHGRSMATSINMNEKDLDNFGILSKSGYLATPNVNDAIRMTVNQRISWDAGTPTISNSIIGSAGKIEFDIGLASGVVLTIDVTGIFIADDKDIRFTTNIGGQIGGTPLEKFAFWGETPIVQPVHIADVTGGATIDTEARVAINAILAQLASTGLQAGT